MRLSRLAVIALILLAALVSVPAWGSSTALPGTINYIEGQVSIGKQALNADSVGSTKLQAGQALNTADGRAEILLTPGIFLRLDNNSSLTMVSPSLTDTKVELLKGRANVEVTEIHKENSISILSAGATTHVLKKGLYEFDADRNLVRVFDGKATVEDQGRSVEVNGGRQASLNSGDQLKAKKFDKDENEDELYRWSRLRSSYLSEANADAARIYVGNTWYGGGWYWDPWFGSYTFIPANGVFYSPFGWGFYSPSFVFGAPVFIGPRFHHFVGFAPRFDPRTPHVANGFRPAPSHPVPGIAGVHPVPRFGGTRALGGGFHGASGFHGGSFHGGGLSGGGFHGGGSHGGAVRH